MTGDLYELLGVIFSEKYKTNVQMSSAAFVISIKMSFAAF